MRLELQTLLTENQQCNACTLSKTRCGIPVVDKNKFSPSLMIVAEHPEYEDDLLETPFNGRNSLILRKHIFAAGFNECDLIFSYMVRCDPKKQDWTKHVDSCKMWLWKEMLACRPKVILSLGSAVTSILLKKKTIKLADHRGKYQPFSAIEGCELLAWESLSKIAGQGKAKDGETIEMLKGIKEKLDVWTV